MRHVTINVVLEMLSPVVFRNTVNWSVTQEGTGKQQQVPTGARLTYPQLQEDPYTDKCYKVQEHGLICQCAR